MPGQYEFLHFRTITLLMLCSLPLLSFAQSDNGPIAGTYSLVQDNGWTNITLPNGDRAEIAPLPQTFSSFITLDHKHYCSRTSSHFSAGIQTITFGRWRLHHDTLSMTFSKQYSSLLMPGSSIFPLPEPYKEIYIWDAESRVLKSPVNEGKAIYRKVD